MNEIEKIKEKKKAEHDIQSLFIQFRTYFNFQRKIDSFLKGFSSEKGKQNKKYEDKSIQNMFCLIDKNWINKWKRYINYSDIYNQIPKTKIKKNDFDIISPIIEKHFVKKILPPLDMTKIYKDNKLDIYSNFEIFLIKYSKIFFPQNLIDNPTIMKCYPIRFYENKYIITLDDNTFQIEFKEISFKQYFVLLIIFKETNEEKAKVIKEFENEDTNEWLKKINFDIKSDSEKDITKYNCIFTIFNKTLKLKKESAKIKVQNSSNLHNFIMNNYNNNISIENKKLIEDKYYEYKQYIETQQNNYYKNEKDIQENNELISNNNKKIQNNNISPNKVIEPKIEFKNKDNNENIKFENNIQNVNQIEKINESQTKIVLQSILHPNQKQINTLDNATISDTNTNEVLNNKALNNFNNNQMTNIFANISNNNINNQIQNNLNKEYLNINSNLVNNQNNFQILNANNNNNNKFNEFQIQNNNNEKMILNNNNQFNDFNNNVINPINNNIINNVNIINNNNDINNFNLMNNNNNIQQQNMNNENLLSTNQNMLNDINIMNQMSMMNKMQIQLILQNMNNNQINFSQNNIMGNNFDFNNALNQQINFNNIMPQIMNNDMNNNINNNLNKKLGIKLSYPHSIGLQNIGQTCYMNSTIQCLSNISELSDYLINNNYNINEHPLTTAYYNLLCELFFNKENKKYINPKDFKTILGELNSLFEGFQAADSKDLLFFLIERLHTELNKKRPNNDNNIQKDFNILELESRNENLMLQNFINEFTFSHNSVVSDNFYGVTRSILTCDGCHVTKYSFQTFNMQIFILKKLKEDKEMALGQYCGKLTLMDAFLYSGKVELLLGENMIYCNNCQKLISGKNKQDFYILPKILIIILNRGKNNIDFNEEFDIPEYLDFTNQHIIVNSNSYMKYYLTSVIKHLGESGSSGHFIAYVRNGKTNIFNCYNDATVSKVTINEALNAKISKKDEEKITPYILFYHFYE